ncbi:integrase catalytic domain-containing protein [Trichonephila clavipes]|nr:integrase catalytic domain-containing protein [Trichonephila clavipes]
MKAVSVLEHFSDHGSIHQKMKKNTTSVRSYPNSAGDAVHLDIVTDLTSNAFIATLKRFIFRRGKCAKLYSDNATNFVGANIELKKMFNLVCKPDEALASYMASEGID